MPSYRLRLFSVRTGSLLVATDHPTPEHAGRYVANYPQGEHGDNGEDELSLVLLHIDGERQRKADSLETEALLSGVAVERDESG